MKELSIEIGKRLIELRKNNNMTQQDIADGIPGLTIQMISSYETGKQSPSIETLIKISTFFNISIDYLLTGKKNSEQTTKITTYEELIRYILLILETGLFKTKTYISSDFRKIPNYYYELYTPNKTLYDFHENYNKLTEAKEIMGDEMYNMALDGLISRYKDSIINKD